MENSEKGIQKECRQFASNMEEFTQYTDYLLEEPFGEIEEGITDPDDAPASSETIEYLRHEMRWHLRELFTRFELMKNGLEKLDKNPTNGEIRAIMKSLRIVSRSGKADNPDSHA